MSVVYVNVPSPPMASANTVRAVALLRVKQVVTSVAETTTSKVCGPTAVQPGPNAPAKA